MTPKEKKKKKKKKKNEKQHKKNDETVFSFVEQVLFVSGSELYLVDEVPSFRK